MIASGIGMSIIFQFTLQNFQEDVININVETSFLHWRNTFPAVSMCLIKGLKFNLINSFKWRILFWKTLFRRIGYKNSRFYERILAVEQYNYTGKVTYLKPNRRKN